MNSARTRFARRDSLTVDRVRETNRREACRAGFIREHIDTHVAFLRSAIEQVEDEISMLFEDDPDFAQKKNTLTETKGVGEKVSTALLPYVPELGQLTRNQVSALVGLAPLNCDSGKIRSQRHT